MHKEKIAIVGGGFAGLALANAIVSYAVKSQRTNITITIFEPGTIGPGMAYDIASPDAFKLNHELDFMGSININLDTLDVADFYKWVKSNVANLNKQYASCNLSNPKEYVPRSLYGKYLIARYKELLNYAAEHDISIIEKTSAITNIKKTKSGFLVYFTEENEEFNIVTLTTGNYFKVPDLRLSQTGRYFHPYEYTKYVSPAIADNSSMLIVGSALSAYDAAIYALESGKYDEVVMASRRGMLRKVRGKTIPYQRKYITIDHLAKMAGPNQPFRLSHLLQAIHSELKNAYRKEVTWKEGYTVEEIIQILKHDINTVKNQDTLLWRSIHSSISDEERHEFYIRLADEDKEEFIKKYSSLYQLISAPMPVTNAEKLYRYIEQGKLVLVNGLQEVAYNSELEKFQLYFALDESGAAAFDHSTKAELRMHPFKADVCVDAGGLGRSISHLPLYKNMIKSGITTTHPLGGIRADMTSHYVRDENNNYVKGLYAIGHMTCAETILPHNSIQLTRMCHAIGKHIIDNLH